MNRHQSILARQAQFPRKSSMFQTSLAFFILIMCTQFYCIPATDYLNTRQQQSVLVVCTIKIKKKNLLEEFDLMLPYAKKAVQSLREIKVIKLMYLMKLNMCSNE
jgi:hypothetical protein